MLANWYNTQVSNSQAFLLTLINQNNIWSNCSSHRITFLKRPKLMMNMFFGFRLITLRLVHTFHACLVVLKIIDSTATHGNCLREDHAMNSISLLPLSPDQHLLLMATFSFYVRIGSYWLSKLFQINFSYCWQKENDYVSVTFMLWIQTQKYGPVNIDGKQL